MRVPARLDARAVVLWIALALLAAGLVWWDLRPEEPNPAAQVEGDDPDVVWMEVDERSSTEGRGKVAN